MKKIIFSVLITAILVIVFPFVFYFIANTVIDVILVPVTIYNSTLDQTHDVNEYFDKSYINYNGGEDASVFFDEYVSVEKYKDIAFHYIDGERVASIYKYYTVFVLDVYYDRDIFMEISNNILLEIEGETADNYFKTYDGHTRVAFSGCKIEKEKRVYMENSAAILFDPRYYTIRYAFVCNEIGNEHNVQDAIDRSLRLKTNFSENSWVFDYSDIVE